MSAHLDPFEWADQFPPECNHEWGLSRCGICDEPAPGSFQYMSNALVTTLQPALRNLNMATNAAAKAHQQLVGSMADWPQDPLDPPIGS